jgi:uncharacterized protein YdeI (YjbR/CyaY-like superfamily)
MIPAQSRLDMPTSSAAYDTLSAPTRAAWRAWLVEHHATSPGIWLIIHKKNSPEPGVSYEEAVEEALCFGWIDSKTCTLDATRFKQTFTPRKPKSIWARSNKERVARLIEQGLMAPAGFAAIQVAVANGAWTALDAIDELALPEDFAAALGANPAAEHNWNGFQASVKKGILYFITSARRPETRARRIARTVELAEQNIRVMVDQP